MPFNTFTIGAAVTPTVISTGVAHYVSRKPRRKKPTAHISYDEGISLIRKFLTYASHHTVEELQSFTSQWVPHRAWVRTENVVIPAEYVSKSADVIIQQLGSDGIREIGGRTWWQWRRKGADLKAEWIEMRSDYHDWKKEEGRSRRIMLYVHGGGYFFGSVDEHRYQLQRHARKLKARIIAPRYRLAPQFPFPCGLQDCLAVYLYLLTMHEANEILLAGDSAGGGMMLSMLCMLRDRMLPMPAGAILISPWVDLTHSFPSVSANNPLDYIPPHGFHHKPSTSWPPPDDDQLEVMAQKLDPKTREEHFIDKTSQLARKLGELDNAQTDTTKGSSSNTQAANRVPGTDLPLSIDIDGKLITLKGQVQMYTTNKLLANPMVSPVLQPSLGGLPPLLIMTGGGEMLRDEQIFVAHKAAHPQKYPLGKAYRARYDPDDIVLNKYKPTPVQLQVWEDLCHVAPTLSFTRPAKYMYRSIAQFGAWALARAQNRPIEIDDDDNISIISTATDSETNSPVDSTDSIAKQKKIAETLPKSVGKAGDPLPMFVNHIIRQSVDRHGNVFPLPLPEELPATSMDIDEVGLIKPIPIKRWMEAKRNYDLRFASLKRKLHERRLNHIQSNRRIPLGPDEHPPAAALAGRRTAKDDEEQKKHKSVGLSIWSGWGSKHDEHIIEREEELYPQTSRDKQVDDAQGEERTSRPPVILEPEEEVSSKPSSRSRRRSSVITRNATQRTAMSRKRTMSVTNQGQLPDVDGSIQPIRTMDTDAGLRPSAIAESSNPTTPPSTAATDQSFSYLSPDFMPKLKQPPHLRAAGDDTASMMTGMSINTADDASTMALFNAPGVITSDQNFPQDSRPETPAAMDAANTSMVNGQETSSLKDSLATKRKKDHVTDGYDTPASRRSVERLMSNQFDDGQSIHSAGPNLTAASLQMQRLRSPSNTAIVKSEGIAGVVPGGSHDEADGLEGLNGTEKSSDPKTSDTTKKDAALASGERPQLYDRQDSEFQTANEGL